MQNSFEKDVRQKMEELKLTPSAPVWERIEVEVKVERKKRRGIFWLLFAALFLAGGWWLYQSSGGGLQPASKQTPGVPKANSNNERTKQAAPEAKENLITKEAQKTPVKTQTQTTASTVVPRQEKIFETPEHQPLLNKESPSRKKENVLLSARSSGISKEKNTPVDLRETPTTQSNDRLQNATAGSLNAQPTPQFSPGEPDSSTKKTEAKESPLQTSTDTLLKKKIASTGKWRKEILLNAGSSNYGQAGSLVYSPAANYSTSPSQSNGVPIQPSKTTAGFFFSLGFSAAKKLGDRWEIAAGIQYAYASTHQKLGANKAADTLVQFAGSRVTANGFYTNAGTNDYTARFHFVEMPVSVSFRPLLRLPLYVTVGAAYGRLLSTNALTFSNASNLYYRNESNDQRNTLPVFSSVQVALFGKKKVSLRTGPFLQYNLLKLQKENYNGVPHLFSAGLKTAVVF